MRRVAFTMIELIFVIVIMGILSKFGVEFLAQAYNNFIYSSINNSLQAKSEAAIETIAARLQFRIKDSIIARDPIAPDFQGLSGSTLDANATILEWVGMDIDGLRGNGASIMPLWSGIIDLNNLGTTATTLVSPQTDTTALNIMIGDLSQGGGTVFNDAAIYFVGSNSDVQNGYAWDGNAIINQNATMHPISRSIVPGDEDILLPVRGDNGLANDFLGNDVYEYYQLAWTAYAVVHNTGTGDLTLWYDYQPWLGETYLAGSGELIMEDVDTFRFTAIGSIVKIQVCVNSNIVEVYSLCKEKTIY